MNWVCTDAWKGPLTQTLFSGGLMVGTVLFGYISDHYGRLKTVYGSAIIMTLSGLITPFCLSFTSFSFIRFVMGMSFNSLSQNFLLLGNRSSVLALAGLPTNLICCSVRVCTAKI